MIVQFLNILHKRKLPSILNTMSNVAYFLKGHGWVGAKFHEKYRAYEYNVNGRTYLCLGPGWAYTFDYLKKLLLDTYNYFYTPKDGDVVIDIGAGLGEESVIYAELVGKLGRVYPFEANPITFAGLAYLLDKNNFSWTFPQNTAIYKEAGIINIEDDEENYLINTINSDKVSKNLFSVKATTLDAFVKENNISKIDFLKSNIEGAEKFLIEGMGESISIVKNICISCHDFRHNYHNHGEFYMTKEKVINFFTENGFELKTRNTGNRAIDDYVYGVNKRIA